MHTHFSQKEYTAMSTKEQALTYRQAVMAYAVVGSAAIMLCTIYYALRALGY